jgi:hypothetical protein
MPRIEPDESGKTACRPFTPPPQAGVFVLFPDFYVVAAKRPWWIHRAFVRCFLGWRWVDYPEAKAKGLISS